MAVKTLISLLIILLMITLLFFYWVFPTDYVQLQAANSIGHSNFSINQTFGDTMQFYENMRYPNKEISFRIEDCPIVKKDEMLRALTILEEKTILSFYEVSENEEISITCDDILVEGERGAFIAGEGGVTKIIQTKRFNVILNGKVLLLRESKCPKPIVGIHELLHALGFDHSENPNNIMYPTINCDQTLGEDLKNQINYIYSFPSIPDLSLENASAKMKGRYLNINLTIKNDGLDDSKNSSIIIFVDGKQLKEFEVEPIEMGKGMVITLENILVLQPMIDEVEILIDYDFPELDKENNRIRLVFQG